MFIKNRKTVDEDVKGGKLLLLNKDIKACINNAEEMNKNKEVIYLEKKK